MSTISGEVSVTPVKRKEISSSSDSTPQSVTRSKKQEKKRRRKQQQKLLLETCEDESAMSTEQATEQVTEQDTEQVTEQAKGRDKEMSDIHSALADISKQLGLLKVVQTDVGEVKGEMQRLVNSLEIRIEILEKDTLTLKQDNDRLQNEISVTRQQNKDLKAALDAQMERIKQNEKKQNDHEQHGRLQNLRVFGVPEPAAQEKETISDCREKVAKIFQEKLGVDIGVKHIEVAHRVGSVAFAKANDRVRPIIVRFLSREDRDTVILNRKKLKGLKISVGEDLTPANVKLLKRVHDHPRTQSTWSTRGNIFAKLSNGSIVKVDILADVNKVVDEGMKRGGSEAQRRGGNDSEMV